jgi:RNA polymerase sigma-70 factor (ECF subfamily)
MSMSGAEREAQAAAELVARAKAGDPRAFDDLVRRYRRRIYACALHISGSQSEADDITQDVFLSAFRALDGFQGRSEFFTWVYRMTVNRSLNARRNKQRRGEQSIDESRDPRIEIAVEIDAKGDPRRAAELRQTYARLLRALDGLPAEMGTTVVLVALQGLSHGEAAVVQKCSEGTIAWRMHEARERLHAAMAPSRISRKRTGLSERLEGLLTEVGLPVLELEPDPS